MNEETIISLILGLIGGGGVVQLAQAWTSHRRGVREADVAADQYALNALVTTVETLRAEVTRLAAARVDDAARLDEQGEQIGALVEENRLYRRVVLGVVERLRRIPPLDAAEVIGYISTHIDLERKNDD